MLYKATKINMLNINCIKTNMLCKVQKYKRQLCCTVCTVLTQNLYTIEPVENIIYSWFQLISVTGVTLVPLTKTMLFLKRRLNPTGLPTKNETVKTI